MKISKSKQELARIISENGGWRDGEFAAQDGDKTGSIDFFKSRPCYEKSSKYWRGKYDASNRIKESEVTIKNFHQTILSRAEYFHLYPAPDADGWVEWKGGKFPALDESGSARRRDGVELSFGPRNAYNWRHDESCPRNRQIVAYRLHKPEQANSTAVGDNETNLAAKEERKAMEYKSTIEQLMQIHSDRAHALSEKKAELLVAERQESKALGALKAACKDAGFDISPIEKPQEKQEPELAITDWRDLQVGDVVFITSSENSAWERLRNLEVVVISVGDTYDQLEFKSECGEEWAHSGNTEFKFIRRP